MSKLTDKTVKCDNCGKILQRLPYRINGYVHHFCNKDCVYKFGSKKVICFICGKTFRRSISLLKRSKHHLCSVKCRGKLQSEFMMGKKINLKAPKDRIDIKAYQKKWAKENKEKMKAARDRYEMKYGDKLKKRIAKYTRERRRSNSGVVIAERLRARIKAVVKRRYKSNNTMNLVGVNMETLKSYLQWTALHNGYLNFNIDNYNGREYHIDHIIPCFYFDLSKEEDQKKCFHYTNLQILTARENLIKNKRK